MRLLAKLYLVLFVMFATIASLIAASCLFDVDVPVNYVALGIGFAISLVLTLVFAELWSKADMAVFEQQCFVARLDEAVRIERRGEVVLFHPRAVMASEVLECMGFWEN